MEIICKTFLALVIIYWMMPTKKMQAVNQELKSLLQVLPISSILKAFKNDKDQDDDASKGE
jgi:hypothetical protein